MAIDRAHRAHIMGRPSPSPSPAVAAALAADAEFTRALINLGMTETEAVDYVASHSAVKALAPEEKHAGWARDFGPGIADSLLALATGRR